MVTYTIVPGFDIKAPSISYTTINEDGIYCLIYSLIHYLNSKGCNIELIELNNYTYESFSIKSSKKDYELFLKRFKELGANDLEDIKGLN